jgi:hypothetical protein
MTRFHRKNQRHPQKDQKLRFEGLGAMRKRKNPQRRRVAGFFQTSIETEVT